MERILAAELHLHTGTHVHLAGWLHHQRRLRRVTFLVLRDRAGLAQIVLDEPLELVPETVRDVEGHAVRTAASPSGSRFSNPRGACSDATAWPSTSRTVSGTSSSGSSSTIWGSPPRSRRTRNGHAAQAPLVVNQGRDVHMCTSV